MNESLVENNLPLVISVAARFFGRAERDDLIQAGSIGLVKAASAFDPSRGTRFSTYAFPLIAGEIRHFLRGERLSERKNGVYAYPCAAAGDDTEAEALSRAELSELLSLLGERERALVYCRWSMGFTQKETAALLKVSQSCVSRMERRIRTKLSREAYNASRPPESLSKDV